MRMETGLQARQEMGMKLAPQVIQSIEILQLPLIELGERIDQELEENPLLEREREEDENSPEPEELREDAEAEPDEVSINEGEEAEQFERLDDLTDYYEKHSAGESPPGRMGDEERGAKQEALENSPCPAPTLEEHLHAQLAYLAPEEPISGICENIIANLDDRGYLASPLGEILDSMGGGLKAEQGRKALEIVQGFEPRGAAARDLKECLLLQLDPRDADYELTSIIIRDHFEDIMKNRMPEVARSTGCSLESIQDAVDKIGSLNPRPGALFANPDAPHVMPDVSIRDDDGTYEVVLENAWLPSLRICAYYAKRLKEKGLDPKTRDYLTRKLQAAQGIISAIEQRRATLESVTKEIVKAQKEFFDRGEMHLKPLKMQDVADAVGIHVSTVSRAIANKYVQTPQGIYSLRRFFTGGIRKEDGDVESWDVVRKKLLQVVQNEDKKKPLSDDAIADQLNKQGIDIARRTVAKYRKNLGIPSSRMRRRF